ncbi:hypothetical protein ACL9RL_01615 [Plantibacter sp. Mn2098]|uniref:hypothetical protein n=1 Tax=Plantibacter sp. Mn2098 TaxID=3395266 RepID=UPI003BCE0FC4
MTTTHESLQAPSRTTLPTFASSDAGLNEGYAWATAQALEWVRTGRDGEMPSYWAGLTDRPMFYSRDLAHQTLGGHLLGLDVENYAMLEHFVASATPARQHYPLWAFMFDGTPAEIDYRGDDDFVRETPVVFELVERILEQHLWTGDRRYVDEAVFREYFTGSATSFVELHDIHGTGLAGELGTGDIFRGSPTYNEGSKAPGLQVAGDGVASQWAAMRAIADVLGGTSDAASAGASATTSAAASSGFADLTVHARSEAGRIKERFESEWWSDELGRYVTGMGADAPVTEFAYEPSWFPALKGIMDAGPRADAQLDYLDAALRADLPPNIEAMTYVPEAFLAYGRDAEALHWIRHLIDSRADYPEVSFCVVSQLLTGLTGLRPEPDGSFTTSSHITDGWIEVGGVPLRDRLITVRHDGATSTTVTVEGGDGPIRWTASFGDTSTTVDIHPGETVRLTA